MAVILIALIAAGYVYQWNWMGFYGFNQVTIATDYSSSPPKITRTEVNLPMKTVWDWLQLLIVPAFIALIGLWFNIIVQRRDARLAASQMDRELTLAYE